ncbi:hypothetical protein RRG08_025694 [Elysia crispata]|uniref:Uncharacterized protein n=1 Tax=Elysia crispata TaxID=231223 RepID=A0AAE1E7D6_9GAST|nr:hypothetical protein RRG08_025694 [Elysia crispata]
MSPRGRVLTGGLGQFQMSPRGRVLKPDREVWNSALSVFPTPASDLEQVVNQGASPVTGHTQEAARLVIKPGTAHDVTCMHSASTKDSSGQGEAGWPTEAEPVCRAVTRPHQVFLSSQIRGELSAADVHSTPAQVSSKI